MRLRPIVCINRLVSIRHVAIIQCLPHQGWPHIFNSGFFLTKEVKLSQRSKVENKNLIIHSKICFGLSQIYDFSSNLGHLLLDRLPPSVFAWDEKKLDRTYRIGKRRKIASLMIDLQSAWSWWRWQRHVLGSFWEICWFHCKNLYKLSFAREMPCGAKLHWT